jgi:hypothetical protein
MNRCTHQSLSALSKPGTRISQNAIPLFVSLVLTYEASQKKRKTIVMKPTIKMALRQR